MTDRRESTRSSVLRQHELHPWQSRRHDCRTQRIAALPYLDVVVRETFRLHTPVTITGRIAMEDAALPLSMPLADKHGNLVTEIPIRNRQRIVVPILALHTAKSVWGEDALEFKYVLVSCAVVPSPGI